MWRKQPEAKVSPSDAAPPPLQPISVPPPVASIDRPVIRVEREEPLGDITRLTPGILVKGELSGQATLYVDGEIQGPIRLTESDVTVGPSGRVRGDIQAHDLMVQGSVRGNLQVGGRILLGRSSQVTGNLMSERVIIEEGADFHGRVDMGKQGETRQSRSKKPEADPDGFPSVARLVKDDRR
jgi:cytoskeletal protein CcmA (bactofilin family)